MRFLIPLVLLFTLLGASPIIAQTQPNIIFILADDLGWQDVGFSGAEFFETPHIDRLAGQGMTFTASYSGGPNCSPTRASLMSGTYTSRHHIYTPGGLSKGNTNYMRLLVPARKRGDIVLEMRAADQLDTTTALNPEFICIPEVLKDVGYASARLGKWHIGRDTQGFDLSSSDGKGGPGGDFHGDVDVAEQLTDRAIEFIEDNQDRPFFLYLSHWDVHVPHHARQAVVDRYTRKLEKLPESQRQNFNPQYAGMIEAVDTSVGRIVAKVDALGLAENTLIIFTSDNGGFASVSQLAPLRGSKGSLFEGGVRVPTCMRWPGVIRAGSSSDTPITSVDYLPTFAHLAGAGLPESQPSDGVNIAPLLRGKQISHRSIFWHYPLYLAGLESSNGTTISTPSGDYYWRGIPSTSMRRGDWKLIEYHEDESVLLYNLKDDPGETHDLAESMPELVSELHAELDRWQADTHAPIPSVLNPRCVLP